MSEGEPTKKERKYVSEDAQEVSEILSAVSEFIASIKGPIKELIDMIMSSLDGKKLGEEVAKFYRELKDSGLPEDMIKEMVREFFRKKLESAPSIGALTEALRNTLSRRRVFISTGKPPLPKERIEDTLRRLEEVEKLVPEEHKGKIGKVKEELGKLLERFEEREEEEEQED